MSRNIEELYPNYSAEIREIKEKGFSAEILYKILRKHKPNAMYNRRLYDRYRALEKGVPIFDRKPLFDDDRINNRINNDFFSEIVDFKTGYFAGAPIMYGYNKGEEAEETTGGETAVDRATKALTDFTTRNNMYGCDMEITKFASIYGYAGRLFYIDPEGEVRVMAVQGYETIILSDRDISEPEYAVRYYEVWDINRVKSWIVEFYDDTYVYIFKGYLSRLEFVEQREHLFDHCPLQGIANNRELMGDAEKVLPLIDDYDKVLSDNSNEIESFVHAYMVFKNLNVDENTVREAQHNGALKIKSTGTTEGDVYFLTKDINDEFTEHHLDRLRDNIYRFSKTPNLNDESFGSASGISLKFKLHGLETKCGMFEAKLMDAAQFMWKLLCGIWDKKNVTVDPLQITMEFTRNFPLDTLSEAQTVQALIAAGIPKEVAFSQLSFVDDVDYVMEMIEREQNGIAPLDDEEDDDTAEGDMIAG
ncbi:MAG: phage portal protein [Clostridiales bacterium]|nr:phage portal protein [Clostridiales bacterium]